MKGVYECKVVANTAEAPDISRLVLSCPQIAREAEAGQFVNVRVSVMSDPLLRRPFSIECVNLDEGTFSLLYVIRGKATRLLADVAPGEMLSVVGPLGKPFDVGCSDDAVHVLVAGGCGVAPIHFLCSSLVGKFGVDRVVVLVGAQTKSAVLCENDFRALGVNPLFSTNDGTYGAKGLVTDMLSDYFSTLPTGQNTAGVRVYACGPRDMLKEVARISREAQVQSCQVSLENVMACGIGVCLGCVQKIKCDSCGTPDEWLYKRVCTEGPVFEAGEVIWE
ncbi:MAG: dihydroorotate dehydrogenase electron transfer subunit [Armatimonadota bacterium]|nr:dihydroorotate dehydrogenase electron transfer subunit [Armatimonadota bacterium]